MAANTLKELFSGEKVPDRIVLDIEIAAKITEELFKIKDPSLGENVVDLYVSSVKKFSKFLLEGNRIRLIFVEVDKKGKKIITQEKTRIFQLKSNIGNDNNPRMKST